MKKISIMVGVALCMAAYAQAGNVYSIEAESLTYKANWQTSSMDGVTCLFSELSNFTPMGLFDVPQEGEYNVWARSRDFAKVNPGIRKYQVSINEVPLAKQAGGHMKEGWAWENIGKVHLKKGGNEISLKRTGVMPRCDAFIFAEDDSFVPDEKWNDPVNRRSSRLQMAKVNLDEKYYSPFNEVKKLTELPAGKKVGIQNDVCKILYVEKADGKKRFYERSVQVRGAKGEWLTLPACDEETLFVGYCEKDPVYTDHGYFSRWEMKSDGIMEMSFADRKFELDLPAEYPYAPQEIDIGRPEKVERTADGKLKLSFSNGVIAVMSLPFANASHVKVEAEYAVKKDGYYTLGMTTFTSFEKDRVAATQMPPLFQLRNTMQYPKMLGNRFTSQGVALVQINDESQTPFVYGVAADPDKLPREEWSKLGNSLYGFSLASPQNKVQTAVFQPILGARESLRKEGDVIKSSWYVIGMQGRWMDALESTNNTIFPAGKIFREAYDTSFSDAAANIAKYLKDENHSGWSPQLKGRWNIEDRDLVTNATPLAELSVAMLTDDEEYYKNISLGVIEYTLTRLSSHFSDRTEPSPYSGTPYAMSVPSRMWKADYYAGLNRLMGNTNPWLDEIVKNASTANLYSNMPEWVSLFGIWIASPSDELLERVKASCDNWLVRVFLQSTLEEGNYNNFANVDFYPYWWYLPDLYEATKDPKYLDYAQRGAFHSMAALWAYPSPVEGEMTINKQNVVRGIGHIWWKGPVQVRIGWHEQEAAKKFVPKNILDTLFEHQVHDAGFIVPEKKVDGLKVSRIGLGIEQPSTFKCGGNENDWNILMPSWSAEMLRVYKHTGRDILMKYSRHAIIGRYANFLGYYVCDFTDIFHDEMYPYSGPDITSFYYHHAPCHFAQTYDYLMAQFEIATKGGIKFPYVRQQGYVWFTDRIFGLPGEIYGEKNCRPIIDKEAVRPASPKVSVLTARSEDNIIALLLNDSAKSLETEIEFGLQSKLMRGAKHGQKARLFNADGKETGALEIMGRKKVSIPAQSVVMIKIPAERKTVMTVSPSISQGGHLSKIDASETFKDLHLFRIRGPFGKDSLYAAFTGGVAKDAEMTVKMTKPYAETFTCGKFPFEVSVYPLPTDADIEVSVSVQEKGKPAENMGSFTLKK